jgi:hypothetical protein
MYVYMYAYAHMYAYLHTPSTSPCTSCQFSTFAILYLPYGHATLSNHLHMFMARFFFTCLSVTSPNLVDSWFSSDLELVCANCSKHATYKTTSLVPCALIISSDSFYWLNCLTHQNLMADFFNLCLMSCMDGIGFSTTISLHS